MSGVQERAEDWQARAAMPDEGSQETGSPIILSGAGEVPERWE